LTLIRRTRSGQGCESVFPQASFADIVIPSKQEKTMNNIKFVVKVNRIGARAAQYVKRIDRTPVEMTIHRKLALIMGRLTAEDAVKSIQTARCNPELVSVQVRA
jgi:hypothetical protein